MSLSSKTELARALFRSTPPDSVTRISGTATADSADGTVTVQLEDGDVIEVGTIGSVSSGDTVTIHVQRGEAQVIASEGWGDAMQAAVDEATAIAEATGQHFWSDTNGAHVTEVTQEQWQQSQTGHNILVNSLGILLRKALNYIAAWTGSALSFYDGDGNAASNVTASFGSAGVQVGKVDESHIEMDYHSLQLIDNEGDPYLYVSDLRDNTGVASVVSRFTGDGSTTSFWLPMIATDTDYTVTVTPTSGGTVTKTTTEVRFSTAPSNGCLIEVSYDTRANYAKAFTYGSRVDGTDIGAMSFSAGYLSSASGFSSTAFGVNSKATGTGSFAIGESHAEGDGSFCGGGTYETENLASGRVSFAYGMSVQALGDHQTVFGKINEPDSNNEFAFIIGNGTTSWGIEVPSNAFTVDWSGNVEAAGDVRAGGSTPLVPIGTILDFAAATAPTGYLVCDGSAVSRSTYAALFAVIGTTWGSGNGSTTFNVPDFRGRTSIGSGTGTGGNATAHALGSKGGDEELQSHSHNLTNTDYKIMAIKNESGVAGSFNLQAHSSGSNRYALASTNSANLTYYAATASAGSGGSGNMQPFATVTKIIRAI